MSKYQYDHEVRNRWGDVLLFPEVENAEELYGINAPIDIYAESLNQVYPLGTKLIRGHDEFAYCKNGTGALTVAGTPIQQAKAADGEQDDDIGVDAIAAIGALTVNLTSTGSLDTGPNDVANDFREGYLVVNDGDGQGQLHKIKANEAFSGTAVSTFTLYEALKVALATGSKVGLIRNPFYKTIATEAVVSGLFIGVNLLAAITANYYFWAKTKGPAPAVTQAVINLGSPVVVGITAAKFNQLASGYSTQELLVGHAMTPGVTDTEQFILYLKGM